MEMSTKREEEKEKVEREIKENGIEIVRIECEDTNGISRGFNLCAGYFLNSLHDGVGIPKDIYLYRIHRCELLEGTGLQADCGFSDCHMVAELKTFRILPWLPSIGSVLTEVRMINASSTVSMPQSSRNICKIQLEKLRSLGLKLFGSYEFEFYLLSATKKTLPTDENVFSTLASTQHNDFILEVLKSMKEIGLRPEKHHREGGQSQHEITYSPAFHIDCPDNAFLFRNLVKDIAMKHNMCATFLSKPIHGQAESSGHFNHSLWDLDGNCVMYDSKRNHGFSELAEYWLAGLRHHSSALMALAATTGNCYDRIRLEGLFKPINNSWGMDNRTTAFRIKNQHSPKLYIENRLAGAAVNPYLFEAGCIIAGMDGIKQKLTLDVEASIGDVTTSMEGLPKEIRALPTTMEQGLHCLESNEVFLRELGPDFMKCFLAAKKSEISSMNKTKENNDMFKWYRENYAEFL